MKTLVKYTYHDRNTTRNIQWYGKKGISVILMELLTII